MIGMRNYLIAGCGVRVAGYALRNAGCEVRDGALKRPHPAFGCFSHAAVVI
jgi:hypothetical protein